MGSLRSELLSLQHSVSGNFSPGKAAPLPVEVFLHGLDMFERKPEVTALQDCAPPSASKSVLILCYVPWLGGRRDAFGGQGFTCLGLGVNCCICSTAQTDQKKQRGKGGLPCWRGSLPPLTTATEAQGQQPVHETPSALHAGKGRHGRADISPKSPLPEMHSVPSCKLVNCNVFSHETTEQVYSHLIESSLRPGFFSSWLGEGSTWSGITCEHWAFSCSQRALAAGSCSGHPKGRAGRRGVTCQTRIALLSWGWWGAVLSALARLTSSPYNKLWLVQPPGPKKASWPETFSACWVQRFRAQPQETDCLSLTSCVSLCGSGSFLENGAVIALSWGIIRIKCL